MPMPKSDVVEVYLPVAVAIDWKTGEIDGPIGVDFEGAPWMQVDQGMNVWDPSDDGDWITAREIEEMAITALHKKLTGKVR